MKKTILGILFLTMLIVNTGLLGLVHTALAANPEPLTISGWLQHKNEAGIVVDSRYIKVEAWEKQALPFADYKIAEGYTDDTGHFTFSYDVNGNPILNEDPGLGESGTRDIYIKYFAENEAARVSNNWVSGILGITYWRETTVDYDVAGPVWNIYDAATSANSPALGIPALIKADRDWLSSMTGGWKRDQLSVLYPDTDWPNFFPIWIYNVMRIPSGWADDADTISHEYGHAVHYSTRGGLPDEHPLPTGEEDPSAGTPKAGTGNHWIYSESSGGFALTEGWAEFFECARHGDHWSLGANDYWMGADGNGSNGPNTDGTTGEIVEGAFASILWDIYLHGGFSNIWTVFSTDHPDRVWSPTSNHDFYHYLINRFGETRTVDEIFIDQGIPVIDDAYDLGSGNDDSAHASNLGIIDSSKNVQDLIVVDPDWYTFATSRQGDVNSKITVEFDKTRGNLDLFVYRSDGTPVGTATEFYGGKWVSISGENPGTFRIEVVGTGDNVGTLIYEGDSSPDYSLEILLVARSGGPDYFGYTYLDSNSLNGPRYNWIEIATPLTGTGTEVLPSSDDQWVGNIGLGFFFNYYGTDYSQLAIGNNGLLFSGVGTSQFVNDPITQSPTIHGFIASYWDDLVTWGSAGAIYYQTLGTAPNRQFVVEWYDNQHYYSSTSGITFEAVLYEGSNNILFQYKDVDFGTVSGSTGGDLPPYNNGGSATVGIEDPTGSIGLQYSFNEHVINPGLAILFKFPAFAGTNMHLSMNAPVSMDHGNTMTYILYYNDLGDVAAPNVVLQATLSANLDFASASDSGIYNSATRTVTWNLGTVPAFPAGRGSTTISAIIPTSVPVGTVIQTTSSISTTILETRYDDNSASVQTMVTGSNLPPNVGVGPTLGNTGGIPSVYWGTPITFTYHDATATGVDIRIHLDDGGSDLMGSMTGGPPDWTYTVTFYPRHGHATVTYTVHGPTPQSVVFNIYVDPAGYVYDVNTLSRVAGASVWLQIPDGQGGWENAPTGQSPPTMQPDTNPLVTGTDGQFQWDVLEGAYLLHVEAAGYYPADSIVVNVPPPVTDLHIGLTPLPVSQYQIAFDQTGVGNDFAGAMVIVDGTNYSVSDLPAVFSWDQGTVHNFSFASPLSVNSVKEYVWTGTTGLSSAQNGSIDVTTDGTIVGSYRTQYYLTVQTSPTGVNSPVGEGWYDAGSSAPISTEQFVKVDDSWRYRFTGWITSNIAEIANSSSPSTAILMDEAKTATANYVTQYNTTFDQTGIGSDYTSTVATIDTTSYGVSTLPASFWWDNGSTHTFAFQSPLIVGSAAKQYDWTFTSGLSPSQSNSITITSAGSVTGNYVTHVHDVAVTSVVAVVPHCSSKVGNDSWVFQGRPVYINVTVLNKGDFDEKVTVTLYYNSTPSNSAKGTNSPNISLSAGQSQTIVLVWNTTAVPYCLNYTISAVATIPSDNNSADNTLACGPINVRIMGDINGDGKVDGKDIVAVAMSFPSWGPDFLCPGSPPGARWNLDCDINCDNRIDGKDLVLVALNFGK